MSKAWYYLVAVLIVLLVGNKLFLMYLNKTYTKEEIEAAFEPITTKYGIKIEYEIGDDFFSSLEDSNLSGPARYSKVKPIRHRVLMQYPTILQKAFNKYPDELIKKHLNRIHFAREIEQAGVRYGGSYDLFRKIIYLVDNGQKNDDQAMGAFHHEFSSLLMWSNTFNSKDWTDSNPKDFKYLYDVYRNWKEMNEATKAYTDEECYNNGFVGGYGLSVLENDFNEYSRMIFTYPKQFEKIMNQFPRVRGKFKVWLKFYQSINPVFTEEYFFGKSKMASK